MKQSALSILSIAQRPRTGILAALMLAGLGSATALAAETPANTAPNGSDYCLQVKDQSARATCELARTQFYASHIRAALVTMRKASAAAPKDGVLHGMVARIMLSLGDKGSAERELREARKDGAPDDFILPLLFTTMIVQHEEINLLNEFPEPPANAKGEAVAIVLQGRAEALQSLGRLPEAAAAADRALALHRYSDLLLLRSRIASGQNNLAMTDKLTDEAYKLDPHGIPVMMAKVHQFERAGNDAGVIAMSDQVLKISPTFANARVAKLEVFLKQNDTAKAKTEVNAFFARSPKSPFGLYYNAVLLSRAKDKKGAAQAIQSLPPEFVRTYPEHGVQMAQILFDNGNVEIGAAVLGAAISAQPDLLDARLRLAELRLSQNSPQSAMTLLTPVKDSSDPRVKKLVGAVQAHIAKDRSF